jgi:hypothetical protein
MPSPEQVGVACTSPSQQQDTISASLEHVAGTIAGESGGGASLPASLCEDVPLLSAHPTIRERVRLTNVGVRGIGRFMPDITARVVPKIRRHVRVCEASVNSAF